MSQASQPAQPPAAKAEAAPPPRFLVSSAPHLADSLTTRRIMFEVVGAMLPLFGVAIWIFGFSAVRLTLASLAGCLATEAVANKMRGRSLASLTDGSAIVTGMILAFSVPPALATYQAFLGGVVAIALAKMVFGGLGKNLFNPAMVGRAFLMICFPAALTTWSEPMTMARIGVDAVTQATPLGAIAKGAFGDFEMLKLFVGKVPGCVGETSTLAALIGGLYLVFRGVADWRQPLGMLGAAAIFAAIAHQAAPDKYAPALVHLNSGALMFGAFFIATEYVGAPLTPRGRLIFGVGCGVLVMTIRSFGAYPEGVMFAILIMNALTPLIERWTVPKPYGGFLAART
jgi:electron transport complex protein RnfD